MDFLHPIPFYNTILFHFLFYFLYIASKSCSIPTFFLFKWWSMVVIMWFEHSFCGPIVHLFRAIFQFHPYSVNKAPNSYPLTGTLLYLNIYIFLTCLCWQSFSLYSICFIVVSLNYFLPTAVTNFYSTSIQYFI